MSRAISQNGKRNQPAAVVAADRLRLLHVATFVVLLACLAWSYWPTLNDLFAFWQRNQDYSVGQLVPLVAIYLIWRERSWLSPEKLRPTAWGLALVMAAQVIRFLAVYYAYASAERFSFVLTIAGLILLLGGWVVFRRLVWVQLFLLLMVPLPQRVHNLIALPLQTWATRLGCFGLELLGFYVRREGNMLYVDDQSSVLVAEACSGLRMLTAFVFTAALLCFLIRRPSWQKLLLLVSSIPIAVAANGLRVLATSVVIHWTKNPLIEQQFHDVAGLAMMPLAVLILVAELKFLALLMQPNATVSAAKAP